MTNDSFGRDIQTYIEGCLQESKRDAVAIGDIFDYGTNQFNLTGGDALLFLKAVMSALLESGARVVRMSASGAASDWELLPKYVGLNATETLELLLKDLQVEKDPYGYWAWFANPHSESGILRF